MYAFNFREVFNGIFERGAATQIATHIRQVGSILVIERLVVTLADVPKAAETSLMEYIQSILDAAHRHSSNHRVELECSDVCGCIHCRETFTAAAIEEWIEDEGGTALCPRCGVDSVIGTTSGYPASDRSFLNAMHDRWFG